MFLVSAVSNPKRTFLHVVYRHVVVFLLTCCARDLDLFADDDDDDFQTKEDEQRGMF